MCERSTLTVQMLEFVIFLFTKGVTGVKVNSYVASEAMRMHGTIAGSKIFLDNNETISFMKANESGTHTFLFDEILSPTQFKGYFSKGLDALKKQLENLRKKNDKAIITINAQQQLIVNQQPIDLIESNSTAVSTSDAISTVNKNKEAYGTFIETKNIKLTLPEKSLANDDEYNMFKQNVMRSKYRNKDEIMKYVDAVRKAEQDEANLK
jgi:hypothetical protein